MRTLLSLLASLSLGSQVNASDTQNITQWHAVYQATMKKNSTSALNMLQDRYHTADSESEKLYVSGLIYDYMSNIDQPYYGSSQNLEDHFAKLESKYLLALTERRQGNYDASENIFTSLLKSAKERSDEETKALMNYQLCYTLNQQGRYHKANFFCSSLNQHLTHHHKESIPTDLALRIIANNFDFRGDYETALNLYRRLLTEIPPQSDPTAVYNDVGNLLSELGQYEQSEQYLIQALLARQIDSSPIEVAQVEHSLASMYNRSKDYEKAVNHYKNTLTLLAKMDYPYGKGLTYLGLGSAYVNSGDLERAIPHIQKALEYGKKSNNDRLQTESHLAAGFAYLKHHVLDKALQHGEIALELANKNTTIALQAEAQLLLSQVHQKQGDDSVALSHYQEYARLELASRDTNNVKAIEALDLTKNEYEYELQLMKLDNERNLKLLEIEKLGEQKRVYSFIIFCLLTALLVVLFVLRKIKIKSRLDRLTGSLNRSAIIDKISSQTISAPENMRYVLVLIDMDRFKSINDKYGHPTGDLVLKHVCQAVQAKLNKGEYIGRLGGEEFILLLKNVDEIDVPFRIQSLQKSILEKQFVSKQNESLYVTASLAYLSTSKPLSSFDRLYSILDQALSQSKKNGHNALVDAYNEPIVLPLSAFESTTA
ncbi:diguanylate cyclase [Vibrio sp. AND4]|uniref:tetratricopeptide repeat-containing diguanylate cyclase n=1 Tax=Vibrio sp. AND4 TaxID=314289 RepID=UPI00015EFBFC|nr:diguanylate cyclase [Vibrio sp. AND4]EDP59965.1 putative GGDEF family protein [Vibrio sp. AND4]